MKVAGESFGQDPPDKISESVIAALRLHADDISRIRDEMRASRVGFVAAAISLGLITDADVERVLSTKAARRTSVGAGIVETALARIDRSPRALVPQQSGRVRAGKQLIIVHDPDSNHSELVRNLRTQILHLHERSSRSLALVVLSPGAGEGRSQLAAELAIAFSQIERPTLLLDADLRRPKQQLLFDTELQQGLAQCLLHNETAPLLGVEQAPYLSLLLAGTAPPNPLELLSGRRFERLMAEFRRVFDFIIIDSPPASEFADALTIAQVAGAAVIVTRKGSTRFADMKEMLRRVATAKSRVLGAVVQDF